MSPTHRVFLFATANTTLERLDMSAATIAEGTELYRMGIKEYGIFNNCTALKEVILPAAEEAAKLTKLTKAFEGCTALTDIDLSLLTGATDIDYAFSGTAITKADLSGCSEKVLAQFAEDVEKCELGGYVVLTEVHDDGDDARVLVRKEGDVITEMVVISAGEDPAIIQIEGKITEEEAAKYIASSLE